MTVADRVRPLPNLKPHKRAAIALGSGAAALIVAIILSRPRFDLLLAQPGIVKLHVLGAVLAFALGAVLLVARKGRAFHIAAGWTWVCLMAVTAGASLFITGVSGVWSWIHILTGTTLIALPLAVTAARRHNVISHRKQMVGLYIGAMIIAGGFTFIPGRLMWAVFFG